MLLPGPGPLPLLLPSAHDHAGSPDERRQKNTSLEIRSILQCSEAHRVRHGVQFSPLSAEGLCFGPAALRCSKVSLLDS